MTARLDKCCSFNKTAEITRQRSLPESYVKTTVVITCYSSQRMAILTGRRFTLCRVVRR